MLMFRHRWAMEGFEKHRGDVWGWLECWV